MRKYKHIDKITRIEIIACIKCDICGKEITGKYWRLTAYHNDWGNDSIDSYKHLDLCSRECINKTLDDYIKNCEYSCTQCFELEQDIFESEVEE